MFSSFLNQIESPLLRPQGRIVLRMRRCGLYTGSPICDVYYSYSQFYIFCYAQDGSFIRRLHDIACVMCGLGILSREMEVGVAHIYLTIHSIKTNCIAYLVAGQPKWKSAICLPMDMRSPFNHTPS
jgi:hypothetical protein